MLAQNAPSMAMFPHRKHCEWIEQGHGLSVRVCDDGEVLMYHDADTRQTWLPGEPAPRKWQRYFHRRGLHGFGATPVSAGVCPPHPHVTPHPSPTIRRLQAALQGLAHRTGDKFVNTGADGLVGQHTIKALNRAMYMYAKNGAPAQFTTGALTRAQVMAFAPQLAAFVQRSPFPTMTTAATPAPPPDATGPAAVPAAPAAAPEGDSFMPAYYPQQPGYAPAPAYYPQQPQPGYYPQRGPGGLPTDQASVDVRAFIPAQYEHVRINPGTVMMVLGAVVIVALALDRKKKAS